MVTTTSKYCFELEDNEMHYNAFPKQSGVSTVEHEQRGDGNMYATAYTRTCHHSGTPKLVTSNQIAAEKRKKRKKIKSWRGLFAKQWPRDKYGYFEVAGLSSWKSM